MRLNESGILDAYLCWKTLEMSYGRDKTGIWCLSEYLRDYNLMSEEDIKTFRALLLKITERKIEKHIRKTLDLDKSLEELMNL